MYLKALLACVLGIMTIIFIFFSLSFLLPADFARSHPVIFNRTFRTKAAEAEVKAATAADATVTTTTDAAVPASAADAEAEDASSQQGAKRSASGKK